MSRVIAGEINEMGLLYEKYKKPLYAYFFKITSGNNQASEDLVHTVFYRAIRYKSSFSGGSFINWLFKIAHNASIDHQKKLRSINNYRNEMMQNKSIQYDDYDPDMKEQLEVLEIALGKLNHDEKELIILGKIESLKYRDIAEITGISEGNVKIRIFRAMMKLKDIFMKIEKRKYEKGRT
jgi:RNA polymerase sigma-70 factor (ECF subfamily)